MAKFYGIGTGPGDPELLTMKAIKRLGEIDILYTPQGERDGESLAESIVKEYLRPQLEIRSRYFPMSFHTIEKKQMWDEIAKEIVVSVQSGKNVGFVTLGDPMIYSTYVYILERVQNFVEVETLSGISSFSYIAASQNFPLVMGKEALVILPCTASEEELDYALSHYHCIVLMKVYKHFYAIREKLRNHHLLESALLVSDASKENEKVYRHLDDACVEKEIGYFSTILVNKKQAAEGDV